MAIAFVKATGCFPFFGFELFCQGNAKTQAKGTYRKGNTIMHAFVFSSRWKNGANYMMPRASAKLVTKPGSAIHSSWG